MIRIAAIGDMYGNSAALDAVLHDIDKCGADTIVNVGDHFSGPLDSKGTANLLLSRDMISIRGNHDRLLLEKSRSEMGPSDLVADSQLEQAHKDWLSSLAPTARVDDVFLCHGTPNSDTTYWMESVTPDGSICKAEQDQIEQHAVGIIAPVIICGHTHLPRLVRLKDGRLLVNPGSVGCPGYDDMSPVHHVMQTGTPDASYAMLEQHGSQWTVSMKYVRYDSREMVKLATAEGRLEWASALATGWVNAEC